MKRIALLIALACFCCLYRAGTACAQDGSPKLKASSCFDWPSQRTWTIGAQTYAPDTNQTSKVGQACIGGQTDAHPGQIYVQAHCTPNTCAGDHAWMRPTFNFLSVQAGFCFVWQSTQRSVYADGEIWGPDLNPVTQTTTACVEVSYDDSVWVLGFCSGANCPSGCSGSTPCWYQPQFGVQP